MLIGFTNLAADSGLYWKGFKIVPFMDSSPIALVNHENGIIEIEGLTVI